MQKILKSQVKMMVKWFYC